MVEACPREHRARAAIYRSHAHFIAGGRDPFRTLPIRASSSTTTSCRVAFCVALETANFEAPCGGTCWDHARGCVRPIRLFVGSAHRHPSHTPTWSGPRMDSAFMAIVDWLLNSDPGRSGADSGAASRPPRWYGQIGQPETASDHPHANPMTARWSDPHRNRTNGPGERRRAAATDLFVPVAWPLRCQVVRAGRPRGIRGAAG